MCPLLLLSLLLFFETVLRYADQAGLELTEVCLPLLGLQTGASMPGLCVYPLLFTLGLAGDTWGLVPSLL